MDLIWKKNTTTTQKVACTLFLLGCIGPIDALFVHNFHGSEITFTMSSRVSIALSAMTVAFLVYTYRYKGIRNEQLESYSKLQKILIYPMIPVVLYGYYWMIFGVAVPKALTKVVGESHVLHDEVWKETSSARGGCKYRLATKSMDGIFFHYCITRDFYFSLPGGLLAAELHVIESPAGKVLNRIDVKRSIRR